jgi:hypothetical protein
VVRSSRVIPTWDGRTARLEIENLELEDAGLYTCVAENEVGRTRCSARLVVLEKDDPSQEDRRPPVFLQELPAEVVATDGDMLDLQVRLEGGCSAESHSVYIMSPSVMEFYYRLTSIYVYFVIVVGYSKVTAIKQVFYVVNRLRCS